MDEGEEVIRKIMGRAAILRESVVRCPECGHQAREEMPVDSCVIQYKCKACHVILKPRVGDCCVFCSYGSVPCPPGRWIEGDVSATLEQLRAAARKVVQVWLGRE